MVPYDFAQTVPTELADPSSTPIPEFELQSSFPNSGMAPSNNWASLNDPVVVSVTRTQRRLQTPPQNRTPWYESVIVALSGTPFRRQVPSDNLSMSRPSSLIATSSETAPGLLDVSTASTQSQTQSCSKTSTNSTSANLNLEAADFRPSFSRYLSGGMKLPENLARVGPSSSLYAEREAAMRKLPDYTIEEMKWIVGNPTSVTGANSWTQSKCTQALVNAGVIPVPAIAKGSTGQSMKKGKKKRRSKHDKSQAPAPAGVEEEAFEPPSSDIPWLPDNTLPEPADSGRLYRRGARSSSMSLPETDTHAILGIIDPRLARRRCNYLFYERE